MTADSLRLALGRASQALLSEYLEQLNAIGAELSLSSELAAVSEPLAALAAGGGDLNPARADEPYRRAITGMYARLAATYHNLTGRTPQRPATVEAPSLRKRIESARGSANPRGLLEVREPGALEWRRRAGAAQSARSKPSVSISRRWIFGKMPMFTPAWSLSC